MFWSLKVIDGSFRKKFLLKDGGGSCFITPEESEQIAKWEGIHLPKSQRPMTSERRKKLVEEIANSMSPENGDELRQTIRNIDAELDEDTSQIQMSRDNYIKEQLFKDDYDTPCGVKTQLKSMRRDKFLTSHPEIKEKRENMFHTLVIGMQQEEGITESLNVSVIETLLETVDNELYVLYPEYNKAINHI